jgi:hypothetical protein
MRIRPAAGSGIERVARAQDALRPHLALQRAGAVDGATTESMLALVFPQIRTDLGVMVRLPFDEPDMRVTGPAQPVPIATGRVTVVLHQ